MSSNYSDENIASSVEISYLRWWMTAGTLAVVTVLCCITYSCADSRAKDYSTEQEKTKITSQQRVECVKAGGSWMPVQAITTVNGYNKVEYEMGCVSASNSAAVMSQNNKIIEIYKP